MNISRFVFAVTSIGLVSVAVQPAFAAEDEAQILEPTGPWQLDMGENKCRIARVFGEEGQQTVFYLEQWNPSSSAQWLVAGPPLEKYKSWRDTHFQFGPGGAEGEFHFQESTMGEWGNAISHLSSLTSSDAGDDDDAAPDYAATPHGLPGLDAEAGANISRLSLSQSRRPAVVLELGEMKNVMVAMNDCMANLVEHWGFDVEEQKTVQSSPKVTNLPRITKRIMDYYPHDAWRKGAQADFHLRLTVAADGSFKSCTLLNQTLAPDFDMERHPCTAFERIGEFEPALTANGTPVESFYTVRIRYVMPS